MLLTKTMLLRVFPNRMLQLFAMLLANVQPGDEVDAKFFALKKLDDQTFRFYLSDEIRARTLEHTVEVVDTASAPENSEDES